MVILTWDSLKSIDNINNNNLFIKQIFIYRCFFNSVIETENLRLSDYLFPINFVILKVLNT